MTRVARIIVIGNEKGGAGKSTVAMHVAVALLREGARVAAVDLDVRQRSFAGFFANRVAWAHQAGVHVPHPDVVTPPENAQEWSALRAGPYDFVIADAPGADTEPSRMAHQEADLVVTPINDSFIDFAVLGVVDPVTLEVRRPSHYAEAMWSARKARAVSRGGSIDWVVLRNRLASVEARNRRRIDERLEALAKRIGFQTAVGLRDRVIYREMYPFGLTVSDLSGEVRPIPVSLGHIAARQELRTLLVDLDLLDGT